MNCHMKRGHLVGSVHVLVSVDAHPAEDEWVVQLQIQVPPCTNSSLAHEKITHTCYTKRLSVTAFKGYLYG